MKIGILETGRPPEPLAAAHGDYAAMFARLIGAAEPSFTFRNFAVLDGELPETPDRCDGWIVSGSRFGVYDRLPWMEDLKEFLRRAVEARVPVVGICFGHQILAEAFGGRVVKSDKGWGVGPHTYEVTATEEWMQPPLRTFTLNAMHQDQIDTLPEGARLVASSPFCPYAALAYDDAAISIQPHPEFDNAYEAAILERRRGTAIPEDCADRALAAMNGAAEAPDATAVAHWIANFLKQAATQRAAAPSLNQ